ncbi:MAG: hypothetical protein OXU75_11195 [Deltaproteobacteria bacterium]|nr:hypothetical protein [Deltaproteobacteria bacterium]
MKLAVVKRLGRAVKTLDWIGRKEDAETVGLWVWRGVGRAGPFVGGLWTWIMSSWQRASLVFVALWLLFSLLAPTIEAAWREGRTLKKAKEKRLAGWGDILPDMKRLAEDMNAERQDAEGDNIALLGRNRIALARIVRVLAERDVPHPSPTPRHGDTEEWEMFLWNFIGRVEAGEAHKLATLHQDMREAIAERREAYDRFTRKLFGEVENDPENG